MNKTKSWNLLGNEENRNEGMGMARTRSTLAEMDDVKALGIIMD